MNLKIRLIILLTFHLLLELILTLISSINSFYLLISTIIYLIIIIKEKTNSEFYSINYYSSIIYILFHYIIFTLSYAEILPWETAIVLFLIILIIYYNKKILLLTKSKEESDPRINNLIIKCQLTNICLYLYTFHLCVTTICTPQMYFNWFLIIKNCRFTYSTLHSSYTLSGGIIVSLTWAIISIYYFIKNRIR